MFRRSANGGLHRTGAPAARPRRRSEAGFTLLEIIAVIALAGLISALLIGGSTNMLKSVTSDDVQNTALSAIAAARESAVQTGTLQEFTYDDKARTLNWGAGSAALSSEGDVRLLPAAKTSSILVGGQLLEAPLAKVRFYADGTCDPFRLEIRRNQQSSVLVIDPWTCTALAPDPTPGAK